MNKFTRLTNPARKRKSARRRSKARRIPNGGGVLTIMSANPKRKSRSGRRTSRHSNPSMTMDRPRRRGSRGRRRSNPGFSSHRRHSFRRRNPAVLGLGLMELIKLGAGAAAGGFGARAIPQAVLGSSNSGWMGYASNIVATFGLGWLANKFAGRDAALGVLAGGLSATGMRIWGDYAAPSAPVAQAAAVSGMGDYQFSSNGLGWYSPQDVSQGRGGWYKPQQAIAATSSGASVVRMPARGRAGV